MSIYLKNFNNIKLLKLKKVVDGSGLTQHPLAGIYNAIEDNFRIIMQKPKNHEGPEAL